jgi:hypothetical protein
MGGFSIVTSFWIARPGIENYRPLALRQAAKSFGVCSSVAG